MCQAHYNEIDCFHSKQKIRSLRWYSYQKLAREKFINYLFIELTLEESKQLNLCLEYSFVEKNENIKNFLAANFESIAYRITDNLQSDQQENFLEFLRAYVDIFSKSVSTTTDYTYKHLKRIINNKNLVVVSGDKESCIVLIDKTDYQDQLQKMVDDPIKNGIYKVAEDNTLKDLKLDITRKCFQNLTNQDNFMPLQRYIKLPKLMK